jgi:hypothetical protein
MNAPITETANFAPTPQPTITNPNPGSILESSRVTFQWTSGPGVTDYFLYVGNSLGANDIYSQNAGLGLSATVVGLPTDGRTLYVRLWWTTTGADWQFADYTYTAFTRNWHQWMWMGSYPNAYFFDDASWMYFDVASSPWCYEFVSRTWSRFPLTSGWVFLSYPYAFKQTTQKWYYLDQSHGPCWVYDYAGGQWIALGSQ